MSQAKEPSKLDKPIGRKGYGSIPHLPGSRVGSGDHHINSAQAAICTHRRRDRHDRVIVQEKLDGCLCWGSKVVTDQGKLKIGVIVNQRLPVKVLSYNFETGQTEFRPITRYYSWIRQYPWLRVTVRTRGIPGAPERWVTCTTNHKFWSGSEWRQADQLALGDSAYLWNINGIAETDLVETTVVGIEPDPHVADSPNRQYDITVEGNHNYFASDVLVHNSNVAVARVDGELCPITRSGYHTCVSPHVQHHLFMGWFYRNYERFDALLSEGERVVGEWLAQAHGTRYTLVHEPFVPFDIMRDAERAPYDDVQRRLSVLGFTTPHVISDGLPIGIDAVERYLQEHGSAHGAVDPVEGAVWRVERKGKVDFLAKYVRPGKVDGLYFENEVWNWYPPKDW